MPQGNLQKGLIYMGLYAFLQSCIWGLVRYASEDLSTETLILFRNIVGFLTILPLIKRRGLSVFHTQNITIHVIRSLVSLTGGIALFYAVSHAPMALVVAITFTSPIIASIFSILLFKETFTKSRVIALAIGFTGVLILIRPTISIETDGLIAASIGALMTAMAFLTVKRLSSTERSETVVAYPFLLNLPFCIPLAYSNWTAPTVEQIPLLLLIGLGVSGAQYCLVKAFAQAEASAVLPIDFLRLLVAASIGTLFFNDTIDIWVFIGAAIILIGSVYSVRSEAKLRKSKTTSI